MATKILLADDHALVRKGMRRLLEAREEFCVVGEATNGQEALALASEHSPDIIFMDISMPLLDGIEATRRICRQSPSPHIIVLSMYGSNDYVQQALDAGAQGYILKSSVGVDALVAIRDVMAGRRFLSPKIVESMAADALVTGVPSSMDAVPVGSI